MSNDSHAALALALGAGTGLGLWYLLRDDNEEQKEDAPPASAPPTPATSAPAAAPPPCALRLDAKGLTADGTAIDVPTAIATCKAAGKADLVLADDAPSAAYADLSAAFGAAGILIQQRRNARGKRGRRQARPPRYLAWCGTCYRGDRLETNSYRKANEHATSHMRLYPGHDVHVTDRQKQRARDERNLAGYQHFTLRMYPEGRGGGAAVRHFYAEPATSWKDAYYGLIAAGIVEARRAGRTHEPGGWMLSVDPADYRASAAEALP